MNYLTTFIDICICLNNVTIFDYNCSTYLHEDMFVNNMYHNMYNI